MSSVHTTPEKFDNASKTPAILDLRLRKTGAGKSRDYCDVIVFEKLRFQMFSFHTKTKSRRFQIALVSRAFSKSSVFVTDYCGR